jgi:tRNA(Ile)-lysidine synthase
MRPRLTAPVADLRRAVRDGFQAANIQPKDKVLLAVSGGADSLALTAAVAFEAPRHAVIASVVIIDHGLQTGSDQVALQALARCKELGLQGEIRKVEVLPTGDGMEAQARNARYEELEKARAELGAVAILTGHSQSDQAETVLLGLTRGSGLKSIAGMPVWDPQRKLLRPMLGIQSAAIRQACKDQGIEFWEDPHNQDPSFTRVRIRELIKTMETSLGSDLTSALAKTAAIASGAEEFLEAAAMALEQSSRTKGSARSQSYDAKVLAETHPALMMQTLRHIALKLGAKSLSMAQLETVSELLTNWHGQKSIPLSGITVERVNNELVFKTNKPPTAGASCS